MNDPHQGTGLTLVSRLVNSRATAWVVLVAATVLTGVGWRVASDSVETRARERMTFLVDDARVAIVKRMQEYEQVLRGGEGLFNASREVTRREWRNYVDTLHLETFWPGIQGLGFALMIPPAEREAHLRQVRAEGFPDYTVHPEGERELYSAILYLEPFRDANLRAFGYDMYSERVRRSAMDRARDTGQVALSGRVILVQESDRNPQAGLLMYLPVYREGWPAGNVEERRKALRGFVYGAFRMADLMRGILGHGVPDLDFDLFDGTVPGEPSLLFSTVDEEADIATTARYQEERLLAVPGRTWLAQFRSRPAFQRTTDSDQPLLVGLLGLVVDLLLFVMFRSLSGQKERMLQEAQRIGHELTRAESRYREMVDNVRDCIFQLDANGCWSYLNPAWREISGYDVTEVLGRPFQEYIHPDHRPRFLQHFAMLADRRREFIRDEVAGLHRSGETLWVEVYVGVHRNEQGRFVGVYGTFRDISARRRVEQAIREAQQAAESANRAKSEFLANMSHELRTPLNSLLILSRLLSGDANLTPEQVASLRVIHESGTDLLQLINDILDLSKVEAGRMEVVAEWTSFETLLENLDRQFRHVALSRGLNWGMQCEAGLPSGLMTDRGKVMQILRNLLANAFKFTERGEVLFRIHRVADVTPGGNGRLALTVSDTGIGIPEAQQQEIFETFRQVDGATGRRYGGTGLGLSISRSYARLIGGEVVVESRPGLGSAFSLLLPEKFPFPEKVRLPMPESASPAPTAEAREVEPFRDARVRVLVADDDLRNRYAIGRLLEERVGEVVYAGNGQEVLVCLEKVPGIHLVLLDIMMPVLDGYRTIEAIRRQPRFAGLPIVALTAKAMPGDRERCLNAGASAYLAKPVEIGKLFELMKTLLVLPEGSPLPEIVPALPDLSAVKPALPVAGPLRLMGRPVAMLLVEEDLPEAFTLAMRLQPRLENLLIAASVAQARRRLQEHPEVNVILVDGVLLEREGAGWLSSLSGGNKESHYLILAVSPFGSVERFLEQGVDACLQKPLNPEALYRLVERWSAGDRNELLRKGERA
ncbi:MAG: CHASE domain-containing protein [Magnetococcales bacterium]|nr:CHASE domain-containing protein [Magnetococcales bacterium]